MEKEEAWCNGCGVQQSPRMWVLDQPQMLMLSCAQASSKQTCYFADVQKPPSENAPAVSFLSLDALPCCRGALRHRWGAEGAGPPFISPSQASRFAYLL